MSAAHDSATKASAMSSPQLPLEIWHIIFRYLDLPSGAGRLTDWGPTRSSRRFFETGVGGEPVPALVLYNCLFPGSAEAVWHWILPRTTWKVRYPEDIFPLLTLELDVGIALRHVDVQVESWPEEWLDSYYTPYTTSIRSLETIMGVGMFGAIARLQGLQSLCVEIVVFHEQWRTEAVMNMLEHGVETLKEFLNIVASKMSTVMRQWTYGCGNMLSYGEIDRVLRLNLKMGDSRERTRFMS